MTKLQWQSQLIWFIEKDPFKFMFLHLGRLLVCLIVGYVSLSLCPNQLDWLKTAIQGVVLSAAALPSLYKIVKHTKAHLHMGAFTVLYGLFVTYIYVGIRDTSFFSTSSSISASQVIWQSLFMVLGAIEFYVRYGSQRLCQEETS